MSNLQLIERLCRLLDEAQQIIREQAELLDAHGIVTGNGELEEKRRAVLTEIEKSV